MPLISPSRWPWALFFYALAGLFLGILNQMAQLALASTNVRPGYAVAIIINLVAPLASILLAIYYPRSWTTLVGAIIQSTFFVLVSLLSHNWHFWSWTAAFLAAHTSPIIVAATVGYAFIGLIAAAVTNTLGRTVGDPPPGPKCPKCGYSFAGLEATTCPECGNPHSS